MNGLYKESDLIKQMAEMSAEFVSLVGDARKWRLLKATMDRMGIGIITEYKQSQVFRGGTTIFKIVNKDSDDVLFERTMIGRDVDELKTKGKKRRA